MIRGPPRSTPIKSSAASDVYKRQPTGGSGETAQAVDIDEEFSLIVRGSDGRKRTVRSGEVSVRGLWGYSE